MGIMNDKQKKQNELIKRLLSPITTVNIPDQNLKIAVGLRPNMNLIIPEWIERTDK